MSDSRVSSGLTTEVSAQYHLTSLSRSLGLSLPSAAQLFYPWKQSSNNNRVGPGETGLPGLHSESQATLTTLWNCQDKRRRWAEDMNTCLIVWSPGFNPQYCTKNPLQNKSFPKLIKDSFLEILRTNQALPCWEGSEVQSPGLVWLLAA